MSASAGEVADAIAAIWHSESAKVVAHVARITRDLGLAEDCAQDALLAALEHWPELGLPERPGAWLMTAAKRRALDHLRHQKLAAIRHEALGHETDLQHAIAAREFAEMVDARLDDAGLELLDGLLAEPDLAHHHLLPAVRGDRRCLPCAATCSCDWTVALQRAQNGNAPQPWLATPASERCCSSGRQPAAAWLKEIADEAARHPDHPRRHGS